MTRLLTQAKRIFSYLRQLFSKITNKATKGTGVVVKTATGTVSFVLAIVVLIGIMLVIGIASVPYGMFKKEVPADANGIVDADFQQYCNDCGQQMTTEQCDCKEVNENS